MGKDKLRRFAEYASFGNTYDFATGNKGKWKSEVFHNAHPITLELGCGKGEYTVELGRTYPERNFIGIDIKSNRMWKGAGIALQENLGNVVFLRTVIHKLADYFEQDEIDELWITFPDPFPKERHAKHRLTHARFLDIYKQVLKPEGIIHFKTDDTDLFEYTLALLEASGVKPTVIDRDVHANEHAAPHLKTVTTYYEKLFMGRGRTIKYTRFDLTTYDSKAAWKFDQERDEARKANAKETAE